jgi:hypothetical protein
VLAMTTTEATATETAVAAYVDVWNETDDAARTDRARLVFTDDARLVDPLVDATGPDAIAGAIGALQAQMPGHTLSRTSALDAHHDLVRFSWTVAAPDGTVAVAGTDVLTFAADGRVRASVAFFGDLPTS